MLHTTNKYSICLKKMSIITMLRLLRARNICMLNLSTTKICSYTDLVKNECSKNKFK